MLYFSRVISNNTVGSNDHIYFDDTFKERVERLTLSELQELATFLPDDAIQASINSQDLSRSLVRLDSVNAEREIIKQLILAGASNPVMHALYGLSTHDVAITRRKLNVTNVNGRPGVLSEAQQDTVIELWCMIDSGTPGEKLLSIHQQTNMSINMLWSTVCDLL